MELPGLNATGADEAGLLRRAQAAGRAAASGDTDAAAQRFEELLATQLVKELRRALPDGFFGGGPGADVYEGWLDEHLGASLARSGGLHLSDAIRASLGAKQAAAERGEAPL